MVVAAILGYLLGSIPTAQIVARKSGVDPLRQGDGNPGWWNMRALVGERTAAIVLVGDIAKGAVAGLVGLVLWGPWWIAYVSVFFAMVGHAFPVFAGFRGGRSVLTWAGGMLVISPVAGVIVVAIGGAVTLVAKHRVWGARIATFSFPAIQAFFDPRAEVAVTGALMTFIGLRFLLARTPRRRGSPDQGRNRDPATKAKDVTSPA